MVLPTLIACSPSPQNSSADWKYVRAYVRCAVQSLSGVLMTPLIRRLR